MTLFVILSGVYAIVMVGYYKMSYKMMLENEESKELMDSYPKVYKGALILMSLFWPVMMVWALTKEATK